MRRSRRYEPIGVTHIGTLLAEAIGNADRVRQALGVWPAWEEAVGPQVAAAARPAGLRNGVLTVHVRHSVWMQELQASRETLLRKIRRVSGATVVRELRFRVAALPEGSSVRSAGLRRTVPTAPIPYDVARAIRAVPSPTLRSVMLRVASRWSALAAGG